MSRSPMAKVGIQLISLAIGGWSALCLNLPATFAGTIDVTAGTITLASGGSATVTARTTAGGIATFVINGNLTVAPNDTISVVNNPNNDAVQLLVGNDVTLGAGATFQFSGGLSGASGPGGGAGSSGTGGGSAGSAGFGAPGAGLNVPGSSGSAGSNATSGVAGNGGNGGAFGGGGGVGGAANNGVGSGGTGGDATQPGNGGGGGGGALNNSASGGKGGNGANGVDGLPGTDGSSTNSASPGQNGLNSTGAGAREVLGLLEARAGPAVKAIPTPASVAVARPMARQAMSVVPELTPPAGGAATVAALASTLLEARSFSRAAAVAVAVRAAAAMAAAVVAEVALAVVVAAGDKLAVGPKPPVVEVGAGRSRRRREWRRWRKWRKGRPGRRGWRSLGICRPRHN